MERNDRNPGNMPVGGRCIVPDSPQQPCSLCGKETTHADSIKIGEERKHIACRAMVREHELRTMIIQQDAISACEALGKDNVLFRRLERRLEPYLHEVTADKLCRMITFCLQEIERDPSIRPLKKRYIKGWITDIRGRYLPSAN